MEKKYAIEAGSLQQMRIFLLRRIPKETFEARFTEISIFEFIGNFHFWIIGIWFSLTGILV